MTTWYDRAGNGLAYAPALAAVIALLAGARAWYRRTLCRRSDKYERIARLGTNAHLTFFTSVLGEPPAMHRSLTSMVSVLPEDSDELVLEDRAFLESVYIDRDFYVHTFSDHDGAVVALSVTTRSPRFRPTLASPGFDYIERGRVAQLLRRPELRPIFKIKLGKSRFEALDQPDKAAGWVGAHNLHYYEAYYLGNPGNYQTYVFSINDAGAFAWDTPMIGTIMSEDAPWDFAWGFDPGNDPPFEKVPGWREFRRKTRMNTYTVIGPTMSIEDYPPRTDLREYPASFGPNSNQVRTLP